MIASVIISYQNVVRNYNDKQCHRCFAIIISYQNVEKTLTKLDNYLNNKITIDRIRESIYKYLNTRGVFMQNFSKMIYREYTSYEEINELIEDYNKFYRSYTTTIYNQNRNAKVVLTYDDFDFEFSFEDVSKFDINIQIAGFDWVNCVTIEKENDNFTVEFDGSWVKIVAKTVKVKTVDLEKTRFTCVSVKYKEEHEKTFYYLSDIENLNVNDYVWVPVRNEQAPAIVVNIEEFSYAELPFPFEDLKRILRKSSKDEYNRFHNKTIDEYAPDFKYVEDLNNRCKLLPFIKIMDTEWDMGHELEDGSITMPFPKYSEEVIEWIRTFYDLDLVDENYFKNFEYIKDKPIEALSRDEILTYLTYFIRGEKFCDGLIAANLKNGTIEKLQNNLKIQIQNL